MPPLYLSSTSRALYRVFIAPYTSTPMQNPHTLPPPSKLLLPHTTIRTKVWKKDTQRHALSDAYILDNAIKSPYVNIVDTQSRFLQNIPINQAMRRFDSSLYHLVQVQPGRVDEFGQPDPNHLPTCKIISKADLRQQHKTKLDIQRKAAKGGVGKGAGIKNLELNWAIDGNDLRHRLEKMKGFLMEGRKVEVLLGPKRKGRQATMEECEKVLQKIREAVAECKGSGESKKPEGRVGGVVTLVFQGKKVEREEADVEG
ncbi:hypothetical protein K469DRAFT_692444 [Zopfia rhizophila CBS 207.26]|uniref:Translation initiation factor 3 N-terminal domain-containing protein n=1 Tax=Zopfia rhizophila CBS 207.26 TaxID=1314779 RepID=A0A6A6DMY1_9PEZI|nr:hypothetical protein K469DRAFT_692444 [Zopfia rhizophila CBS 207.26]